MTAKSPAADRRLIPRWRNSREAVNSGELAAPVRKKLPAVPAVNAPYFEELLREWSARPEEEVAADLISCAVALGRVHDPRVRSAARLLSDHGLTPQLRRLAKRILEDKIGSIENPTQISFDPDTARAELQRRIVVLKRWVRQYPRNAIAWTDLARLYTSIGQQGKASDAIRVALALSTDNRFVLRSAARFFVHADGERSRERLNEGLHVLRATRLLRADPWIMAAEISLSEIAGERPRSLQLARRVAENDAYRPWDLSELNGALATMAIQHGGLGKPQKLFTKSLREPTENALAQAQWASDRYKSIAVDENLFSSARLSPFEALALRHRAARNWMTALDECRRWSAMDPTSTRPLVLGAYIAETALEDGRLAKEFSERALMLAPGQPWAHNNMAVALAYIGDIEGAIAHAELYEPGDLNGAERTVYLATRGLIAYRCGDRETGLRLYLEAAGTPAARDDVRLRAMVIWHLLREESHYGVAGTKELADSVWERTRSYGIPELEAIHGAIARSEVKGPRRSLTLPTALTGKALERGIDIRVRNDVRRLLEEE